MSPTVHFDGDSAVMCLECMVCARVICDVFEGYWPFNEEIAHAEDFQRLGFAFV